MFKLFVFIGLLAAVYSEESQAQWVTVAVYPKTAPTYPCEKFNFDVLNKNFPCTCDGKPTPARLVRIYNDNQKILEEVISFEVNSSEEAFLALSKTCDCGKYKKVFARTYYDEDSLIHYEKPANATSEEDLYEYLSVKKYITFPQLQDLLKGMGATLNNVAYVCENLKP